MNFKRQNPTPGSALPAKHVHNTVLSTFQKKAAVSLLLGLLFLTGCCTSKPGNCCWEYRVATVEFRPPPGSGLQDYLNQHATEGWVLDQFVERGGSWIVVMRRWRPK
jgi:hypothetical protein